MTPLIVLAKKFKFLIAGLIVAVSLSASIALDGSGDLKIDLEFGGPHGTPTTTIEVPAEQVDAAEAALETKLRDETPVGVEDALLDNVRDQQDALALDDQLPLVTPLAAPSQEGCVTRLVGNYSSRRGVRPRLFVLHYTVSPNRPGWDDVNAIAGLFDRPSFAASSTYIIDAEGNCAYIVRESDKPWTQAALNPVSISVEHINSGRELSYAGVAGRAKLARVASDSMCRWEIPLQKGHVRNGLVVKAGLVDHRSLGPAGGGHVDISPYSVDPVLAAIQRARAVRGCSGGRPEAPVRACEGRPAAAPAEIPSWAWKLRRWRQEGGQRPSAAPSRVPRWYWGWSAWVSAGRPCG